MKNLKIDYQYNNWHFICIDYFFFIFDVKKIL